MKILFRFLLLCTFIILVVVGAISIYVNGNYEADTIVTVASLISDDDVTVTKLESNYYVFEPTNATIGLVFYPGGSVEYSAYAPLLREFASNGILCILIDVPLNLAILDVNAADNLTSMYPNIEKWYLGGHSLGGVVAADYASKHLDEFEGLLLLASYTTVDIHDTDLSVVSIYGSNDEVLNKERYEENKSNLPKNLSEKVIDGGCHSYFGNYGMQDGDGVPTITREEQFASTITYSLENLFFPVEL